MQHYCVEATYAYNAFTEVILKTKDWKIAIGCGQDCAHLQEPFYHSDEYPVNGYTKAKVYAYPDSLDSQIILGKRLPSQLINQMKLVDSPGWSNSRQR